MNKVLLIAASLSAIAALLHIAIIINGANWYRFFGAGERMARAAERGDWYPALVTTGIALVLASWAGIALAGAGAVSLPSGLLPYLKAALVLITLIYLIRGLVVVPLYFMAQATPFVVWSSVICLVFAVFHIVGVIQVWPNLK
ncbi:hypothetical protein [Solimicrobium silvestre]|uniref:Uncharacterized protein n=1 Tax=Solimicrobium silvestre TaxID=2099400 RepID=A0A2S9GSK4_9BURK|nr:hypothetical protein [Solimicrobium silvestre]PRC90676.1 hypothetical protein S2091_4626 [Solimicrobium silvestre]